jgi:hypothetical protein
MFFSIYGAMSMAKASASPKTAAKTAAHEEDRPGEDYVRAAIAKAGQGDFYDAIARMAIMAMKAGTGRRHLSTAQTALGIIAQGAGVIGINPETVRERVREQAAVVEFAPERASDTLPDLLPDREDRTRALAIFERLAETLDLNAAQQALLRDFRNRLSPAYAGDGGNVVALDAPSRPRKTGRRARA